MVLGYDKYSCRKCVLRCGERRISFRYEDSESLRRHKLWQYIYIYVYVYVQVYVYVYVCVCVYKRVK